MCEKDTSVPPVGKMSISMPFSSMFVLINKWLNVYKNKIKNFEQFKAVLKPCRH